MNILLYLKQFYMDKKYVLLLIILLTGAIVISVALVLFTILTRKTFDFITNHIKIIAVVVGIYIFFCAWLKEKRVARIELKKAEQEQVTISEQLLEKTFCETNYNIAREMLFLTLIDCSEIIKLSKPSRLNELDLPEKTTQKQNFSINQFIILKNGDSDSHEIREILQIRLTQKLNALDFVGINQRCHIYDGNAYPLLMIDDVHDFGKYIHVDVVWTNDRYCKLINARKRAQLMQLSHNDTSITDSDF